MQSTGVKAFSPPFVAPVAPPDLLLDFPLVCLGIMTSSDRFLECLVPALSQWPFLQLLLLPEQTLEM